MSAAGIVAVKLLLNLEAVQINVPRTMGHPFERQAKQYAVQEHLPVLSRSELEILEEGSIASRRSRSTLFPIGAVFFQIQLAATASGYEDSQGDSEAQQLKAVQKCVFWSRHRRSRSQFSTLSARGRNKLYRQPVYAGISTIGGHSLSIDLSIEVLQA